MRRTVSGPAACWWSAGKPLAKRTDLVERVEQSLGDKFVGVYDGVVAGSPLPSVEQGVEMAARTGADLLVALGGGSAVVTTRAIVILLAEGGRVQRPRHQVSDGKTAGQPATDESPRSPT